jgi:hypothetical protein
MLINGNIINSSVINGIPDYMEVLQSDILATTIPSYSHIIHLFESIINSSNSTTSTASKQLIQDYLVLLDLIKIQLKGIIGETLTISESLYSIINQIIKVIDHIEIITQLSNTVSYKEVVQSLISLLDSILFNKPVDISEIAAFTTSTSTLYSVYNSFIELITSTTTNSTELIRLGFISEYGTLSGSLTTSATLLSSLSENFLITIPTASGQDTYLAYLLSPETNSVTNYNNYNFDLCTRYGSKYLFANSSGLYEFGGVTDAGSTVESIIETIAYSFGSSNRKSVPNVYLGVTNSSTFLMKVRVDGKAEVTYKIKKKTSGLDTQKVDIGKGLIGRYFQFELITKADDFKMESIEFFPVFLGRKI